MSASGSDSALDQTYMPRPQSFERRSTPPPIRAEQVETSTVPAPIPPARIDSLTYQRCHPESQLLAEAISSELQAEFNGLKIIPDEENVLEDPMASRLFRDSNLQSRAFKNLHDFYEIGQLCDVEIRVGTNTIRCHKVVLSSVSGYFKIMFTSEMSESRQEVVTIKDIDEVAFRALVEFAYTAQIQITFENVQQLLFASSILQIESVAHECCSFMHKHLHPTNVIGIYQFAEQHGHIELISIANKFIFNHFAKVIDSEEFVNMSLKHLLTVIPSPELYVQTECQVYEAVTKWVKHDVEKRKSALAQLLSHVKLALLPTTYLMDNVVNDSLVKKDLECRDLLDEAKHYKFSAVKLVPTLKFTENYRPRDSYAGVIFCVGGRGEHGAPFETIEVYHLRQDRWFHIAPMNTKRRHVGVVAANGKLYSLGGHDGKKHLSSCEYFDPVQNKWTPFASMGTKRRGIAVGFLNGPLYVVGGLDDNTCYDVVERYDPESDTWSYVASTTSPRGGVGVATFGDMLYAIGGNNGLTSLDSCEKYDPHTNKWTLIANMNHRRAGAGVAILHDHLYVLGGFDDNSPLDSVERYNPKTDTWEVISKMSNPRGGVGVTSLAGRIYAVGGHDGSSYLNSVETYDPIYDSWNPVASTTEYRAGAGVTSSSCLVTDLQEIVKGNRNNLNVT